MIYEKFNVYIKEKYFANIGSHVVLSVDKQVIEEFCRVNSILEQQLTDEFRQLFSDNWELALEPENFFGLIAIQVYIAHLMSDEEDYSKNMYNPRLIDYLRKAIFQSFNIESFYEKYQDELWLKLKTWCLEMGFFIEIPKISKYKGRYIQYPLSQALLNREDLAMLPYLFANAGLKSTEDLSFVDFSGIIKKSESIHLTPHYFKVRDRLLKVANEDLLYWQIFEYFCDWDGEIISIERQKATGISDIDKLCNQLFLAQDKAQIQIHYKNNQLESIDVNSIELFQKINKYYRLPHSDLMFFIKNDIYEDWEITRLLEPGRTNLIICKCGNPIEYLAKRIDPNCILDNKRYFTLIEFEIKRDFIPESFWERFFSKQILPLTIQGGLKLDRKIWMAQAGPDLNFEERVDTWINGKKLEIDSDNLMVSLRCYEKGKYVLKIRNFKPIHFEIREPAYKYSERVNGWQIDKKQAKWEPAKEQFQISGLINTFKTDNLADSEIRDWIDANIGEGEKEQNSNNPLITNAIKRTKHGIRL